MHFKFITINYYNILFEKINTSHDFFRNNKLCLILGKYVGKLFRTKLIKC